MPSVNDTDPLVGRILDGRYEIHAKIDRGGMATVYRGVDKRLTRNVAVKVMHESLGSDAEFVARFDREARAAAGLVHPNIVSVFDQGMDGGRPYIVMEYVQGENLRKIIRRAAPMTPQAALDLLIPVASAVAAAHEKGIMHRDLKPENVLVSDRKQLKVADFGLARAVTANTVTSAGTVIGSVSYLAPELVTNGKADTRADVYALGVILYEMLTGKKPHTGDSPIQVAYSHVHNDIAPPSASGLRIPDYVDAIVLRCVNRQLEARPANASAMLGLLQQARMALAKGKANDQTLTAQISETGLNPDEQQTARVKTIDPLSDTAPIPSVPPDLAMSAPTRASTVDSASAVASYTPLQAASPLRLKQKRRHRSGLVVLLLVLVLAVLLGFTGWYLVKGRYIEVPDFVGLSQTKAETLATKNGLEVVFENAFDENIPAGQVIHSLPGFGEPIVRSGTVTVTLSKGKERYEVPKLVGKTLEDARKLLGENKLEVGAVDHDWDEKSETGTVVRCSQKAGELVKPNTSIDLVLSKGAKPIQVVSFVDKPYNDAKKALDDMGLKVKSTEKFNDTIKKGNVISQTPKDGELHKGDTVTFVVSKGPDLVEVPRVRGLTTAEAKKRLNNAGFKIKESNLTNYPLGFINGSNPGAGKKAPRGSTITLYIV